MNEDDGVAFFFEAQDFVGDVGCESLDHESRRGVMRKQVSLLRWIAMDGVCWPMILACCADVFQRVAGGLEWQGGLVAVVNRRLFFGWRAQDIHGAVEVAAGFDIDGASGDVAFDAATCADEDGAVAVDVAADAGVDFHFVCVDGVDELDVATFDDVESDAVDFADDGACGADDEFAAAFDVCGDDAVEVEVAAFDLAGADVTHFADVDVAASADGGG